MSKQSSKMCSPTPHVPPGGQGASPLSHRVHGCHRVSAGLQIQAFMLCKPTAEPQLGCQLPGSAIKPEVRRNRSRCDPWLHVTQVGALGILAQARDHGRQPGRCQGESSRHVGPGTVPVGDPSRRSLGTAFGSLHCRWAGSPEHPGLDSTPLASWRITGGLCSAHFWSL